jgi:ABC-type nitrate/sulfonate/bicarbonate transport system substrate-binding protein
VSPREWVIKAFGAHLRFILLLCCSFILSPVLAIDKVVLQLKWGHEFQFSGYYAALWQGYYAAEGLDVEIRPASTPDGRLLNPIQAITNGDAHFSIGAIDILLAKDRGQDLVILAPIFQRNPLGIFALPGTKMSNVRELAKLRIAAPAGNDTKAEILALFSVQGINPDAVKFVDVTPMSRHSWSDWLMPSPHMQSPPYSRRRKKSGSD